MARSKSAASMRSTASAGERAVDHLEAFVEEQQAQRVEDVGLVVGDQDADWARVGHSMITIRSRSRVRGFAVRGLGRSGRGLGRRLSAARRWQSRCAWSPTRSQRVALRDQTTKADQRPSSPVASSSRVRATDSRAAATGEITDRPIPVRISGFRTPRVRYASWCLRSRPCSRASRFIACLRRLTPIPAVCSSPTISPMCSRRSAGC